MIILQFPLGWPFDLTLPRYLDPTEWPPLCVNRKSHAPQNCCRSLIARNDDWPENSYAAILKKVPADADSAYLTDSDSEIGTKTDDELSLDLAALEIQNNLGNEDEHLWDYLWENDSDDILSELGKIDTIDQFFDRMGVYGSSDPHRDCNDFSGLHQGSWISEDPKYLSVWDCYCHAHPVVCYLDPINDNFM
jgi:hypothetical protein